jgi:hypothetical protein
MLSHGGPTVAAWCENDAASASDQSTKRTESVQLKESAAAFPGAVFPAFGQKITLQHLRDIGLEQIVQPRRPGSFFPGHVQTAAQAMNKLENRFGFCFQDRFHHQVASRIQNRRRARCLWNIQPHLLSIIHEGVPSCRRCCERPKPTSKGRPFIRAFIRPQPV